MVTQPRPLHLQAVKSVSGVVIGILSGLGLLLVFAFSAFFFITSWIDEAEATRELSAYGRWIDGTVVDISGKENTTLVYIYNAPGADGTMQKYQSRTNNNGRYSEGKTVRVIYSSRQPGLSQIEDVYLSNQGTFASGFLIRNFIVTFLIFAFFICGAYLIITNLSQLKPALAVDRAGISTSGTVMSLEDVETSVKGGKSHAYYVNYEYQVMGQSYGLKEKISRSRYDQLEAGMRVEVRYLPDRPDVARLENKDEAGLNLTSSQPNQEETPVNSPK